MGRRHRSRSAPVRTRSWNAARATTLGLIVSLMRPAYSSASRGSGTPSAHASARRLATTLATTGMSAPTIFSNRRIGQRRRRSYSSTRAVTSYSSVTGSLTRTTSPGKARSYAATKSRTLWPGIGEPSVLPSEMEVRAEPDVLDLLPVELAVGRAALEVLDQELHVPRGQHAVELHAGPRREIDRPGIFLPVLEVHAGDRTPTLIARRPRARVLETVLDRPRLQMRRVLIEEVAGARVDPREVAELVGDLRVHRLVRKVDAGGLGPEQELVAEVARLVEEAEHRREIRVTVREGERDQIVGVHEVLGEGVEVEDREDTGLDADLPPAAAQPVAIERKGLAEADGGHIDQLRIALMALVGGGEVRPARIGDERLEQRAAGQEPALPLRQHAKGRRGGDGLRRRRRRWRHPRLEDLHTRHAPDGLQRGHHARPVGAGEVGGLHADHAVLDAQRGRGQLEVALEDGRRITGNERVFAGERGRGGGREEEDQTEGDGGAERARGHGRTPSSVAKKRAGAPSVPAIL